MIQLLTSAAVFTVLVRSDSPVLMMSSMVLPAITYFLTDLVVCRYKRKRSARRQKMQLLETYPKEMTDNER